MSKLMTFKAYFVNKCKTPFIFMDNLMMIGYVKWIIKIDEMQNDMSETVYKMNHKMKD